MLLSEPKNTVHGWRCSNRTRVSEPSSHVEIVCNSQSESKIEVWARDTRLIEHLLRVMSFKCREFNGRF